MVGKGKKGDQSRGGGEMGIEVNRGHCAPVALLCSAAALRYQPSAPNSQVSTKPQTSAMQLAEELWLRFPDTDLEFVATVTTGGRVKFLSAV